jgi:hypothetical protein
MSQDRLARVLMARDPRLARERDRVLLRANADGAGGILAQGVKWWFVFCLIGRRISPLRTVEDRASRSEKLDEETLLMDFVLWLVYCRPSGKKISWKTARKYVYHVSGWHKKQPEGGGELCGGMPRHRLKALIRGLAREFACPGRKPRYGCRTQHLADAIDQKLGGGSAAAQTLRAALTTGFCGLLRGGEFALQPGEELDCTNHLTRADVRFFLEDGVRHAAIKMRRLKDGKVLRGKTITLVLRSGGTLLDPVRELWRLFELDPVPDSARATTPLFRRVSTGAAFTVPQISAVVKELMQAVGCDPALFGAHSLRIGGATAALAAGVPPEVIRALGRWDSDVYEIYTRLSKEAAGRFTVAVGSTSFVDLERGFQTEALDELAPVPELGLDVDMDDDEDEVAVKSAGDAYDDGLYDMTDSDCSDGE